MNALTGIVLAASLALGIAFAYVLVLAWRRAVRDDALPPIFGMLERQGLAIEDLEASAGTGQLALAVRRCAFCGGKPECRAALASVSGRSLPAFCPNAWVFAPAEPAR